MVNCGDAGARREEIQEYIDLVIAFEPEGSILLVGNFFDVLI